ncbi:MAG: class I SAM-dependent methyltransferase [candidate division KSB1 bacterium]|nr:class I SAM-dependent methyltransferase [candidate division KSB1 bacterium]MDZ7313982.1 class I SAM-dependent methyltransferase [candidate division KSB1 bacterium]
MLSASGRLLPPAVQKVLRKILRRNKHVNAARNTTSFHRDAEPGPLVTGVFNYIKTIPGWFNIDDCAHFYLILSMQSALGLKGDLFEIGSYHGRSTAVMAYCLKDGEKIVVCDAFEGDTDDHYANKPSPQKLIENVRLVNPGLTPSRVVIHQCLSSELSLERDAKFRFAHIDGGHSREATWGDLLLCQDHILPGGVIALDDYKHKDWPGVTPAVEDFLAQFKEFSILADLNRHGAIGRKLYLIKNGRRPPQT